MIPGRDLLRTAVLRTNAVFPFSRLNRIPYRLALRSFVRLCRGFPEIKGIYLRHGMSRGDWVPGLSDIDLTVTFSPQLSLQDEFLFLLRFWAKLAKLRRWFPMLSDVVIVNEQHLPAWTRFGIRGLESSHWKVLYGKAPDCAYNHAGAVRDAIHDALYRYFDFMLVWFFEPASHLRRKRIERVASRILRHAPSGLRLADDPALVVARAILALDQWIGEVLEDREELGGDAKNEESELVHQDTCIIVLPAGLDEVILREKLLRLRQDRSPGQGLRIATRRMLLHWFHFSNPLQFQDWKVETKVVHGSDIVAALGPPDEEACGQNLLDFTSLVLESPYLEEIAAQHRPIWFAGAEFRAMVERGWYLKVYLENGAQRLRHADVLRQVRCRYSSLWQEFAQLQEAAATPCLDLDSLRFRAFCLLRETAVAANRAVTAAQAAQPVELGG